METLNRRRKYISLKSDIDSEKKRIAVTICISIAKIDSSCTTMSPI